MYVGTHTFSSLFGLFPRKLGSLKANLTRTAGLFPPAVPVHLFELFLVLPTYSNRLHQAHLKLRSKNITLRLFAKSSNSVLRDFVLLPFGCSSRRSSANSLAISPARLPHARVESPRGREAEAEAEGRQERQEGARKARARIDTCPDRQIIWGLLPKYVRPRR